jgi:hypothetical protein
MSIFDLPLSGCGQWRRRKMQFICVKTHIPLPNLSVFTHAGEQLPLCFRVFVSGIQLATTIDIERQADMSLIKYRFCGGSLRMPDGVGLPARRM